MFWLLIFIYLLPTLIALARSHQNCAPIFVVNLFLGWTLVGWVISLAWSLSALDRTYLAELESQRLQRTERQRDVLDRSVELTGEAVLSAASYAGAAFLWCFRLPARFDALLWQATGEEYRLIYRFIQVLLYVGLPLLGVFVVCAFGLQWQ